MADRLLRFEFDGVKGERLDKFLVTRIPEFSRSRIQGLIRDGFIHVNQSTAKKAGQELEPGQVIDVRVPPAAPAGLVPEAIPLQVVFENNDLMVINKPAGMVVHPAAGHATGTLVHAALAHAPEMEGIGGELRPGVVHRLDKDTSGLILLAKNDRTHRWLQDQFRLRKVVKIYLALVDGHPPTPQGRIEAPIGRDTSHSQDNGSSDPGKGREAASEYTDPRDLPPSHPAGSAPIHRAHPPDPPAPGLSRLPDRRGYRLRAKQAQPAARAPFLARPPADNLPSRETEPRPSKRPLPPELERVLDTLRNQ